MRSSATRATQTITVDATGRTGLQLVVNKGVTGLGFDHADWADAKLTCNRRRPCGGSDRGSGALTRTGEYRAAAGQ